MKIELRTTDSRVLDIYINDQNAGWIAPRDPIDCAAIIEILRMGVAESQLPDQHYELWLNGRRIDG